MTVTVIGCHGPWWRSAESVGAHREGSGAVEDASPAGIAASIGSALALAAEDMDM
jgi:hypothetical protein